MSCVYICGVGAVSPAGWSIQDLRESIAHGAGTPEQGIARPGIDKPLPVRRVPAVAPLPGIVNHSRLRRSSPISHYAVAAALEALGDVTQPRRATPRRLGLVFCAWSGPVQYSRRFYDEVLTDPSTASPLIFPETVFNAPASHVAVVVGTDGPVYTLLGDAAVFLQGLAVAAEWLVSHRVDDCLVVGAEELDWLLCDAVRLFQGDTVVSEGAGALFLRREPLPDTRAVELKCVTDLFAYHTRQSRYVAAQRMQAQLGHGAADEVLFDSTADRQRLDAAEERQRWLYRLHRWPDKSSVALVKEYLHLQHQLNSLQPTET